MHPIIYPDNHNGNSEKLRDYILEVCSKHKTEKRALAFIIADLHNPHVNKILRDYDYINSLHEISGKTITVFFMMDNYVDKSINETTQSNKMLFEFGVEPINAPPSIMPKDLAKILIEDEILSTPAILFFQVEDFVVKDFFVTKLTENKIEDGFLEIRDIIQKAVNSLSEVKEENKENSKELFNLIKQEIEHSDFWKNAKKNYDKFIKIKEFILPWI
ncbi:hypothetical protein AAIP55_001289 [Flavobacterium psychrophilum]|nr:hypothetical protein [Flavobacterium psychrophilum]EKT4517205.1 hypothetical protein [Flavobacterium psychrophilum]